MSPSGIASGQRAEAFAIRAAKLHAQGLTKSGFTELVAILIYLLACVVGWEIAGWRLPACVTVGLLTLWIGAFAARELGVLASGLARWISGSRSISK